MPEQLWKVGARGEEVETDEVLTVALCAMRLGPGPLTIPAQPLLASLVHEVPPAPIPLEISWAVPSESDYANAVAVFRVLLDPTSKSPVVCWAPDQAWHLPLLVDRIRRRLWLPGSWRKGWCFDWVQSQWQHYHRCLTLSVTSLLPWAEKTTPKNLISDM